MQPLGGARKATAILSPRIARSLFIRLLTAQAVTRKGFGCKSRRATTQLEYRSSITTRYCQPPRVQMQLMSPTHFWFWLTRGEVAVRQVRRDAEGAITVCGCPEFACSFNGDPVFTHQRPDPPPLGDCLHSPPGQGVTHINADFPQFFGHPGSTPYGEARQSPTGQRIAA